MKFAFYLAGLILGSFASYTGWIKAVEAAEGKWSAMSTPSIMGWYVPKRAAARKIDAGKMVVIGGSASLYGIDTNVLEACLHMPTLNFASHAALPLDYHFYEAKRVLEKGDTALLVSEYIYYELPLKINSVSANYLLNRSGKFLDKINKDRRAEIMLAAPLSMLPDAFFSYDEETANRFRKAAMRASQMLDSRGNMTGHHRATREPVQLAAVTSLGPIQLLCQPGTNVQLREIKDFAKWCEKKGIRMYVSFPNTVHCSEYDTPLALQAQSELVETLKSQGIGVIGKPADFFYPADDFYDSNYHLTTEAAHKRSTKLCELLKQAGL